MTRKSPYPVAAVLFAICTGCSYNVTCQFPPIPGVVTGITPASDAVPVGVGDPVGLKVGNFLFVHTDAGEIDFQRPILWAQAERPAVDRPAILPLGSWLLLETACMGDCNYIQEYRGPWEISYRQAEEYPNATAQFNRDDGTFLFYPDGEEVTVTVNIAAPDE